MTTLTSGAKAPPPAWRPGWWRIRQLQGVLYVLPTAFIVLVFFILPILMVVQISASDWELLRGDSGINFPDNYEALQHNSLFWPASIDACLTDMVSSVAPGLAEQAGLAFRDGWRCGAIGFTIIYTVLVTVGLIALGLGLALIVQQSSRWNGWLRTVFLLPLALGLASASLLAWGLYSPAIGPINPILQMVGITTVDAPWSFFGTTFAALMSTTLLIVWKFAGLYMLILLVGLQSIPDEVMEAAAIDGAGRWQAFRRVTLPLLRPALALCLILAITGSLLAFDQFFILTKGGPDNSTATVVQLIYRESFLRQDLGTAAALSIIVLLALLAFNTIQFRGLRVGRDS